MDARRLVAILATWTSIVGSGEGTDNELAGLDRLHVASDFFDEAAVFAPHRRRPVDGLQYPKGPKVRSAHARCRDANDRIR
jgi:hypothetical protein